MIDLDNTDIHTCLCCGQAVERRRPPLDAIKCERAFAVLTAMGFTRKALLTKHRAQLEYQSPGLAEWIEERRRLSWEGQG